MKEIIHDTDKLAGPGFYKLAGERFFSHRQKKEKKKKALRFCDRGNVVLERKKKPAFMLLTLLGMPFILTFNKAAGCPSPT